MLPVWPIVAFVLYHLLCVGYGQYSPPNPGNFRAYELASQNLAKNMCPFLVLDGKKLPIICWQCGFPSGMDTKNRYEYDCCPGFERSTLLNNQCVQMEITWKSIVRYLKERGNTETATALESNTGIPELGQDSARQVYTVFVPKEDKDIRSPEVDYRSGGNSARNLVTKGRHYSNGFTNGRTIMTENNAPLKITTYSNGLIFVECALFLSVDHETTNGLVHYTDRALPPSNRYPTVLSRLQADSSVSLFVQALPADVRSALDKRDSNTWYTVFAPTNEAWSAAVGRLPPGESVANLARHHVINKMLCARAITQESSSIGPTMADEYIRVTRNRGGKPAIVDACNEQIPFRRSDLMSTTGVVHVLDKAVIPLGSMDLNDALRCLQRGANKDLAQAAKEMEECNIASRSKARVVLLPTSRALEAEADRMRTDRDYRCKVYAHHLLTPDNPRSMSNPKQKGFVQEEKFRTDYTTPNGSPAYVTSSYVRERDGSKLSFGGARTTSLKPLHFQNGFIYSVQSLNYPPEKTMIELIREEPNTNAISQKIQETNIQQEFGRLNNKVLFLAPIDMGWKSRDLENSYSNQQTRKLLQLHTIPHPMFGGENGFVWHSTIHKVDSLLTDRSGGKVQLIIKTYPDGNTFIGHSELPEKLWAMVLKWNKVGTDGVVWIIDWPIKCPEDTC